MLHRSNRSTGASRQNKPLIYKDDGIKYFHFELSEKNHEIVLPVEDESSWDQLHEITWDPGRGD